MLNYLCESEHRRVELDVAQLGQPGAERALERTYTNAPPSLPREPPLDAHPLSTRLGRPSSAPSSSAIRDQWKRPPRVAGSPRVVSATVAPAPTSSPSLSSRVTLMGLRRIGRSLIGIRLVWPRVRGEEGRLDTNNWLRWWHPAAC
jgi:hypothetical protein